MAKKGQKHNTIFPHSWFMALDKLPDDVAGRIYKAVHRLDITGEMTVFEEGTIEYILFEQYAFQTKGFKESYAEECKNRSEAAKVREAKKAQERTAKNLVAQATLDRSEVDVSEVDRNEVDVSGGDVSGEDVSASKNTTTTTDLKDRIIQEWNQHDFVQKIKRVDNPEARWLKTLQAIRNAGSEDEYLNVIRSLADHAYFRDQNKKGYRLVYDWFVNPENFQGVIEGKYKNNRSKYGDDWEVVDIG